MRGLKSRGGLVDLHLQQALEVGLAAAEIL